MSTDLDLAISPTPQDYGFPAVPNAYEVTRWAMQERFLTEYSLCGAITKAAAASGCSVHSHENWVKGDAWGYQKRYADAQQVCLDKKALEADRRALEGVDHPVVYQGKITATHKDYSDNLLMFRMKKLDPSYRDNYSLVLEVPDELLAYMQKRQAEDQKALPEAGKVIEHKPNVPPPWED